MRLEGGDYIFETLGPDSIRDEGLRGEWRALLSESGLLDRMYQTPEYIDHLAGIFGPENLSVIAVRRPGGTLAGIIPLLRKVQPLRFGVGRRILFKFDLKIATLPGSVPPLDADLLFPRFLHEIFKASPGTNAVYLDSLPSDCRLFELLVRDERGLEGFSAVSPEGPRPFHVLSLPPTFEEYLSRFKSKHRGNMRRQLSKLNELAEGRLRLFLLEKPEQVPWFLHNAARVARNSWQYSSLGERIGEGEEQVRKFEDQLKRGFLRSYLLLGGDEPYAFVIGHLNDGVYHYNEIAYDQRHQSHSPGRMILYLVIEDLIRNAGAKWLNFGVGDADYKREFGNITKEDCSVYLVRNGSLEKMLLLSNMAFRSIVRRAKSLLRPPKGEA